MKKLSILTLIAPIAIISCVNDADIIDKTATQIKDKSISFSPYVGASVKSQGASVEALESGIMVYAFKTGETTNSYFNGSYATFSKPTGETLWISSPVYFWPQYALDFYGYYPPATFETLIKADSPTTFSYTVSDEASKQIDLVTAFAGDQSTETSVPMNFYHALSKVEFTVENYTGSGLTLKINSIGIRNITNSGDFEITKTQTIEGFYKVTPGTALTDSAISTLSTAVTVAAGATSSVLDSMYLMPQTLNLWAYSETQAYPLTGSYIIINGEISGNAQYTGEIAIPFTTTEWEPGYFYKYNIVFGDYANSGSTSGGGGYNPNKPSTTPGDTDKPQKVLLPIKIDVSVEPWNDVNEPDIIL